MIPFYLGMSSPKPARKTRPHLFLSPMIFPLPLDDHVGFLSRHTLGAIYSKTTQNANSPARNNNPKRPMKIYFRAMTGFETRKSRISWARNPHQHCKTWTKNCNEIWRKALHVNLSTNQIGPRWHVQLCQPITGFHIWRLWLVRGLSWLVHAHVVKS